MKKEPRVNRTIRFDRAALKRAEAAGIDINQLCRNALATALILGGHSPLVPKAGRKR